MTSRHDAILTYLREFPGATVREIGEAVGLSSPGSVHPALEGLERKGLLRREPCPVCQSPVWAVVEREETA